jgi:hypothetical protein
MDGFYHFRRIVAMAWYVGGLYLDGSAGSRNSRGRVSLPLFFPPHRGRASAGCAVDHPPVPPWSCLGCRRRPLFCLAAIMRSTPGWVEKGNLYVPPRLRRCWIGRSCRKCGLPVPSSLGPVLSGPVLSLPPSGSWVWVVWDGYGSLVVRPDEPRCAAQKTRRVTGGPSKTPAITADRRQPAVLRNQTADPC